MLHGEEREQINLGQNMTISFVTVPHFKNIVLQMQKVFVCHQINFHCSPSFGFLDLWVFTLISVDKQLTE